MRLLALSPSLHLWLVTLAALLTLSGCGGSNQSSCPLSSACGCSTAIACSVQSYVFAATKAGGVLALPVAQNGGLGTPFSLPGPNLPGGISTSPPLRELFVSDHVMNKLYAYTTGPLAAAPGSPYSLAASNGFLEGVAATPNGKFVYVVGLAGTISGFSISSDLSLTPIPGSPFPVTAQSVAAATETSSKFLFVVNSSSVSAFTIDSATGALAAAGTPIALSASALPTPEMAATAPVSNFLYVAVNGTNHVDAFSFDVNTGVLTTLNGSPFLVGTEPSALTMTTSTLYVIDSLSGTISARAWDKNTGALSEVIGSPFSAPYGGGVTSLNGQYLYVTSANNVLPPFVNEILGFSVDSSGTLTPLGGSPFSSSAPLWGGLVAF